MDLAKFLSTASYNIGTYAGFIASKSHVFGVKARSQSTKADRSPSPKTAEDRICNIVSKEISELLGSEQAAKLDPEIHHLANAIRQMQSKLIELSIAKPITSQNTSDTETPTCASSPMHDEEEYMLRDIFMQNIQLQKPKLIGKIAISDIDYSHNEPISTKKTTASIASKTKTLSALTFSEVLFAFESNMSIEK